MPQVLDYSSGFPGAGNIRAAGYAGAARYIGFPDRRKCATAGELADFTGLGIGMALVYQDGTGDFLGGFGAGQANARRARDHANAIGFPGSRPVYMAIDRDIVSAGDFDTVLSYLDGAASALGRDHTGVYGEHDVVRRALESGRVRYGWQTAAWSGGRHYAGAHLYQRIGTVTVGGIACDINDVLAADWGQHTYLEADMLQDERDALFRNKEILEVLNNFPGGVAAIGPTLLRVVEILEVFNAFPGGVAAIGPALLDLAGRSAAAVDEAALAQHLISQGYGAGATVEQVKSALAGLRFVTS